MSIETMLQIIRDVAVTAASLVAIWGISELRSIVNEIWVSAQELAELWERQFKKKKLSDEDQKLMKEFQGVIWYSGDKDQVMPRVHNIIQDVERICRPIIEVKSSCFSLVFDKTREYLASGWRWLKRERRSKG